MNQNDPATFTLSVVGQLIHFISYTARCPRQTKHNHYFLPTIFRDIKAKKSSSLLILISYIIVRKMILQKNSCAGKWERNYSFTQRPYGKPKKVNWILKLDWILLESFVFSCVLFMSIFTGFRVYWCIVYMRVSLFLLALSFQLIYRLKKFKDDVFSLRSKT